MKASLKMGVRMRILPACLAIASLLGLAACNQMSDDAYGVYMDGDFYIVSDYNKNRIDFTNDAHPGPEALLKDVDAGKGIGFTTWRNATSCGMHDDKNNYFIVPRGTNHLDYAGESFDVTAPDAIYSTIDGGGQPHEELIKVSRKGVVTLSYTYDDTLGVRSMGRYNDDGTLDRTIYLTQGVGLLSHCRGFSLDDFGWFNKLNKTS